MVYIYTATIHEENGSFHAAVPDIPGCITTGHTLSDAIDQISDALAACLCTMEDEEDPIAPASKQSDIPHTSADVCTLVRIDTNEYRARTDTRAVRKNVSIPAWMAARADKLGINCSKVLQDALRQQFDKCS
jgi:antitoxin HicB